LAPIRVDAARHEGLEIDAGDVGQDHELDREDHAHHARHAVGDAFVARIESLAASGLVGDAGLKPRLIFRRQRRLLGKARRLGLVPLGLQAARPLPLPGQSGYFDSSAAFAMVAVSTSATAPIKLRQDTTFSTRSDIQSANR
jgi:hypothetical protein